MGLAALGFSAIALPLLENFGMAVAFLVAALVAAVAGALSHPRTNAKALIALKAEGAALLNLDPLGMLKRGDAKDAAHALAVFRIAVARWVEEALPALRELTRCRALKREDRLLLVADREDRAGDAIARAFAGGEFGDDVVDDIPLPGARVLRLAPGCSWRDSSSP